MRSEKRKFVIEKAKEILKNLVEAGVPSTAEISEQIKEAVRTHEISSYHGLPAGPNVVDSDNVIVVEGRADVVNLLKYGIRNTVAIEGTSVPPAIVDLAKCPYEFASPEFLNLHLKDLSTTESFAVMLRKVVKNSSSCRRSGASWKNV
jgi:DNA primase